MLNTISLIGRLTKTPELRRTQNGTSVCTFTIAVDRDFKDANGDRETDFIACIVWRGTAEFVANYGAKGRLMCVSGSLQSRKWTDDHGNTRVSWEVQAQHAYFLDKRDETAPPSEVQEVYPAESWHRDTFHEAFHILYRPT